MRTTIFVWVVLPLFLGLFQNTFQVKTSNDEKQTPLEFLKAAGSKSKVKPRLFGLNSSTTTYTNVVLATITVFSSCISTSTAQACAKKKRKRSVNLANVDE